MNKIATIVTVAIALAGCVPYPQFDPAAQARLEASHNTTMIDRVASPTLDPNWRPSGGYTAPLGDPMERDCLADLRRPWFDKRYGPSPCELLLHR
jgi:hypothetical protein